MQPPPPLPDEEARLAALYAYESLDGEMRCELDPLVRLAARLFDAGSAMVSLIDRDEQVVAASCGVANQRGARSESLCAHALGGTALLIVPDAAADPRFAGNPAVTGDPPVRFYAGAPLRSPLGHVIGTLCVMDPQPRPGLSARDGETLRDLAEMALGKLELRRLRIASLDGQRRFQNIAATSPDAIVCTDGAGRITFWNETAERLFGLSAAQAIGAGVERIVPERLRAGLSRHLRRIARGRRPRQTDRIVELDACHASGRTFPIELSLSMWREDGAASFGAIIRDISARRSHEDRLFHLAHHDPLTNLPNRAMLRERLGRAIGGGERTSVLLVDLDGFKDVNDTLGHAAGDAVLGHVAQRLGQCVRDVDTVARLGGDEFAVLLAGSEGEGHVAGVAARIIAALGQPFAIGTRVASVGASVGSATFPGDGGAADDILANADLAMYQAKRTGRGRYRRFTAPLREQALLRRAYEGEIRLAIDRHQFVLYYQPQVDLGDGRVIGAEALVRWMHPSCGLLPPPVFFDALEDSPMAAELGDWVLETACAQAAAWRGVGDGFRVGVNLFAAQLRSGDLVERVDAVLARTGLPPSLLELEVTENIVHRQDKAMLGRLRQLHDRGVSIAFDDFGTGHGSLSMLKTCPIDRLKIDRSFIEEIGASSADAVIVNTVIALGRGLGMKVIAEGVETPEQRDLLRAACCTSAQGYLFGRPMPAAVFEEWLGRHEERAIRA